eukprot:gnl/TRDRNA2_/TRDRNA2_193858_c0_seq1.p1 gnl/TRDRNA2_/TRDRNA2_193858_c0~~gnl/TRDRNA2_/TRDRNA2_193858_c0_seq1.p1  ORF type:complete len:112 (+),score=21.32 gnl/TRDRNA2_/TRDRNA2_193858_c0_seq1:80-415(+)
MGNVEQCCAGPVTIERLERAVRNMNAPEVSRLLAAGVDVNDPVDAAGHTVLDIFAAEHQKLIHDALDYQSRPEEKTRMFMETQSAAWQVFTLLMENGARMSYYKGNVYQLG